MQKNLLAFVIVMIFGSQSLAAPSEEINLYTMSLDELMQVEVSIASKQPETVRQAPSAVTVFTRAEIRAMGIDNVYDLLNFVPGFQTTRLIDVVDQALVHSRGLANLNGEVLFLLNGHRLNENSLGAASRFTRVLATANVKQVEVIRGPGSALYGSNAFLGVVNIITETGGNGADLHAGSADGVGGSLNLARSFGPLAVNASLSIDRDRGVEYSRGEDYPQGPENTSDPRQDLNFYSILDFRGTKFDLGYMKHWDWDFLNFNGVAPAGQAWSESTYALIALSHEWVVSDTMELRGGVSYSRHTLSSVGWFGPANPNAKPPYDEDRLLGPHSQNSSYEGTLDLTWLVDGASDLAAGVSYRHEGTDILGHFTNYWNPAPGKESQPNRDYYLGEVVLIEEVPSLGSREKHLDNFGFYAQYRRELLTDLHAIAGLRYDHYEVVGSAGNPRLSLVWEAGGGLTLKAFWGTAFRAPSLAELYTDSQRSRGNLELKPEVIATTELVCQKRFRTVELEGVYFHNHLTDPIVRKIPASTADSRQTWENGGQQNYDGVEMRGIWDPLAVLRLTLTYTHLFSGLEPVTFDDFASLIADFHAGRWRVNVHGTYREHDNDGSVSQGDYGIVNAKLSYALMKYLTLYGKVDNLFDLRYETGEADISSTYFDSVPNRGIGWVLGVETQW